MQQCRGIKQGMALIVFAIGCHCENLIVSSTAVSNMTHTVLRAPSSSTMARQTLRSYTCPDMGRTFEKYETHPEQESPP